MLHELKLKVTIAALGCECYSLVKTIINEVEWLFFYATLWVLLDFCLNSKRRENEVRGERGREAERDRGTG